MTIRLRHVTIRPRRRRRVPLRLQLTQTECGAACLAMVLSHHGRNCSVPDCRELLGSGRDGVSVPALAGAARRAALTVTEDRHDHPLVTEPVIAYLSRGHFVVVARADDRSVSVVDPAYGRSRMSRADFDEQYGGVLLRLSPAAGFLPRRKPLRDLPMFRYMRDFVGAPGGRRLIALTALLAAGLQVFGLATPLLTKVIVDSVIPSARLSSLTVIGVAVLAIGLLCGVLALLRQLALLALRVRSDRKLTRAFVTHLFRLPIGFFHDRGRGDLLMRLSSMSSARETLTQQLLTMVLDGCLLCGYLIGLLVISPLYSVVLIPLFVVQAAVLVGTYRTMRIRAQRELTAKTGEQSYLVEALQAVVPLKANGVEDRAVGHWAELFDRYQGAVVRRGHASAWLGGAHRAVSVLGPLVLLWGGAWLVITGRMSLGGMLAANSVALSVLQPMETFATSGQTYQAVRAQVERLFDAIDAPEEPTGTVAPAAAGAGRVTVEDVTFRYQDERDPVLTGVSLDLPPGRKLGVVGRTGSGKTTLGLLILGLLPVTDGVVRHDGVALKDLDLRAFRSRCGAVLQELTLFNGTIADNLTLGRSDACEQEIVDAARLAGLHDDVLALPMGYHTRVGEGGGGLSAGQRQRVALARALVHKPRLLLLDEATSHLDPETERRVDEALSDLAVTRIVISHRFNAVRNADQIIALDAGRIVQRGRHGELIDVPGVYRDLFGTSATNPVLVPAPG